MTREEFIELLDIMGYSYEIEGDRIIVTRDILIYLEAPEELPAGVQFNNKGHIHLPSLMNIPSDVRFNNRGTIWLDSLIDGNFDNWEGNIEPDD